MLPVLAHAGTLLTDEDLKTALRDVLSHGNLFDIAYVSEKLDLSVHVSRLERISPYGRVLSVVATTTPLALYGDPEYSLRWDNFKEVSSASLRLNFRQCPSLLAWAHEWGVPAQSSEEVHGAWVFESLLWPGADAISLKEAYPGADSCFVTLDQTVKRLVSVPAAPVPTPVSPEDLARQIGSLLVIPDLRDYESAARVLDVEIIPDPGSEKGGLLKGNARLGRPIRGFSSWSGYVASDYPWVRYQGPHGGLPGPPHPIARSVNLSLAVDVSSVCLSQEVFEGALLARPRLHVEHGHSEQGQIYTVRGSSNLISLQAGFDNGCMRSLEFRQTTDFQHSVSTPLLFDLEDSLRKDGRGLTGPARHKVELVATRLRYQRLGGIQLVALAGAAAAQTKERDLAVLKRLIQEELIRDGIDFGHSEEDGWCANADSTAGQGGPRVCLDAWLEK